MHSPTRPRSRSVTIIESPTLEVPPSPHAMEELASGLGILEALESSDLDHGQTGEAESAWSKQSEATRRTDDWLFHPLSAPTRNDPLDPIVAEGSKSLEKGKGKETVVTQTASPENVGTPSTEEPAFVWHSTQGQALTTAREDCAPSSSRTDKFKGKQIVAIYPPSTPPPGEPNYIFDPMEPALAATTRLDKGKGKEVAAGQGSLSASPIGSRTTTE